MSAHSHDEHHSGEKKPVSFTVPFILACVTVLITLLFLSLCDPGHHKECEGKEKCAKECSKECSEECEKGGHCPHKKEGEAAKHEEAPKAAEAVAPADTSKSGAAEPETKEH